MKHFSFVPILLYFLAGPAVRPLTADDWIPIGPPGGTTFELLLHPRNPNILWAATQTAGVFKSVDGGASWFPSRQGLDSQRVLALAVAPSHPNILYAAGGRDGIFRSSDGGQSWTAVLPCQQQPPPCCGCVALAGVQQLAVDPRDPQTVYSASSEVLKSVDGGATWRRAGRRSSYITSLVFDPKDPGVLYAAGGDGVARSEDGGASWTSLSNGIVQDAISSLVIDPKNPRRMWARGINSSTVYRTVDGGALWRRSRKGLGGVNFLNTLALAPAAGRDLPIVWVGTRAGGAYHSLDGGRTWAAASPDLHRRTIDSVLAHPSRPGVLWAASPSSGRLDRPLGIFKTVDGGATWRAASRGLLALPVSSLAFDPVTSGVLWAGSSFGGVFRSADGGATWTERHGNLEPHEGQVIDLATDPHAPDTVWAGTRSGVFVTEDGGAIWEARNEGLVNGVSLIRLVPANPSVAYAASTELFKTVDAGAHWNQLASLPFSHGVADVLVDPRDPDVVFAATVEIKDEDRWEGTLWSSRDGGGTWEAVTLETGSLPVWSLAADPRNPDVLYAGGDGGIFRSADGGRAWQRIADFQVSEEPALAVSPTGAVWASTETGIFRNPDGLSGWTAVPGLERFFLQEIAVDPHDPDNVLAATWAGIFRWQEGD